METYRAFQEFHCEIKLDGLDSGALLVLCEFQFQIRDRLFRTTTVRERIRRQNRCSFADSHGFYCLFSMISYIFTFSLCRRLLHVCVLIIFFIAFYRIDFRVILHGFELYLWKLQQGMHACMSWGYISCPFSIYFFWLIIKVNLCLAESKQIIETACIEIQRKHRVCSRDMYYCWVLFTMWTREPCLCVCIYIVSHFRSLLI